MKKSLASVFALLILLFSVAANAVPVYKFTQQSVSGHPGGGVTLNVQLESGNIDLGAEFEIGFVGAKLGLTDVFGSEPDFTVLWLPAVDRVLLFNNFKASVAGSPLFLISFDIMDPYPSQLPDDTDVTISFFDELGEPVVGVLPITATVHVSERTVPEPGVLGLTGLALLIMTVVGRRRRANRG